MKNQTERKSSAKQKNKDMVIIPIFLFLATALFLVYERFYIAVRSMFKQNN
jgi:hypothetical protein